MNNSPTSVDFLSCHKQNGSSLDGFLIKKKNSLLNLKLDREYTVEKDINLVMKYKGSSYSLST